jgi:hypothetical protein
MDESQGPLEDLPLEVIRRIPGEKSNTYYEFIPFVDIPVDLSAITEYLDGISYLGDDNLSGLIGELEAIGDDDLKAAKVVAHALFTKRVEELADENRYNEQLEDVDELPPPPWGGGSKKLSKKSKSRPARKTQRKAKAEENGDSTDDEPIKEPSKEDKFERLKARLGDK